MKHTAVVRSSSTAPVRSSKKYFLYKCKNKWPKETRSMRSRSNSKGGKPTSFSCDSIPSTMISFNFEEQPRRYSTVFSLNFLAFESSSKPELSEININWKIFSISRLFVMLPGIGRVNSLCLTVLCCRIWYLSWNIFAFSSALPNNFKVFSVPSTLSSKYGEYVIPRLKLPRFALTLNDKTVDTPKAVKQGITLQLCCIQIWYTYMK